MMPPRDCLRCNGRLEAGFVVDQTHHGTSDTERWVAGKVERSFWSGVKTKGRDSYEVTTWRCTKCGLLESYAVPDGRIDG